MTEVKRNPSPEGTLNREEAPLVEVKNLKKHFRLSKNRMLHAVDGVNFSIGRGQTLGLVADRIPGPLFLLESQEDDPQHSVRGIPDSPYHFQRRTE